MRGTLYGAVESRVKGDYKRSIKEFAKVYHKLVQDAAKAQGQGGFWSKVAQQTKLSYKRNRMGFSVGVAGLSPKEKYKVSAGAAHQHTGGIIKAPGSGRYSKKAKALAIPLISLAKGKNPSDFPKGTFSVKRAGGNAYLVKTGLGIWSGKIAHYVLKKQVYIKPKNWFPFDKTESELENSFKDTFLNI